jgi:hypothetical protein
MIKQHRSTSVLATVVALMVVVLSAVAPNTALAAPRHSCDDTRGSVLAMHSRVLCKRISAKATREHPRWTNRVKNSCTSVSRARSSCTWQITWPGHRASRSGSATVTGIRHVRVEVVTTARISRSSWG